MALAQVRVIIKVKGYQYQWLAGGYDLEIGHFLEVASMVVTWWMVAFLHCDIFLLYKESTKLVPMFIYYLYQYPGGK